MDGAILQARQMARELDAGIIIAVLSDGGDRYLSTALWE